jgi:F-type H+-transporting ATPase subunit a
VHLTSAVLAVTITPGVHITRKLFGITYNLDDAFAVLVAGALMIVLGLILRAKATSGVPGKFQLVFETVVVAATNQARNTMGEQGLFAVPLAVVLFFFILICNWFEIIPTALPGHFQALPAPTGDINMPLALAVLVIVIVHFTWIRVNGIKRYIAHYFRPYKFLFPINVIEELVKPLTLTLRLFGNIFAGGILISLIATFPAKWIIPIPIFQFIWKMFDAFFVSPVQAFIFSLLTVIYLESAVTGGH